jgi:hypothetical protein
MTNDENIEVLGTRPGVIAIVMFLIWLVVSLGVFPMTAFIVVLAREHVSPIHYNDYLSFFYHPAFLAPFILPSIAFIWQMIRYYRGDCARHNATLVGILSVILPTLYFILVGGMFSTVESLFVISPIYLVIIVGIVLMYGRPITMLLSPWLESGPES